MPADSKSVRFLQRVAAPPKHLRLEALLAQVIEFVEVDLKSALSPAKLAPERAQIIEAARHQGREPAPRFVLRQAELHGQIDIADLERAARIGAEDPDEDPDLAHPWQVRTLARDHASEHVQGPFRDISASPATQGNSEGTPTRARAGTRG